MLRCLRPLDHGMHLDTEPKAWGRENREVHMCVPAQGAMAVNMGRGRRDG